MTSAPPREEQTQSPPNCNGEIRWETPSEGPASLWKDHREWEARELGAETMWEAACKTESQKEQNP